MRSPMRRRPTLPRWSALAPRPGRPRVELGKPNIETLRGNTAERNLMTEPAAADPGDQTNEPPELTFDEHLHPARPRTLRFRPRVKTPFARRSLAQDGSASADNPAYVNWLLSQAMLADANQISQQFS